MGHEGKCRNLHGHDYTVEVEVVVKGGFGLDSLGRVIDFGVVKDLVGSWIDQHLDHGFVLNVLDHEARAAMDAVEGQKLYLLNCNPTAENLAQHLLVEVCPELLAGTRVRATAVTVWETPNCIATAAL